jgi:hypothetical protein
MGIKIQYWDNESGIKCITHSLLDASQIGEGQEILNEVMKSVLYSSVFENHLIGLAGDGASSIVKFHELMKEKHSYLYTIHCLPHCFNLIGNFASKAIPSSIENLVKNMFNYFSKSATRTSKWLELQKSMDIKPYRMIRSPETRWSSLIDCLERLLKRYEELKIYFTEQGNEEKYILKMLKKPSTQVYLKFLQVFVSQIHQLNVEFQKNSVQIPHINKKITEIYDNWSVYILKDEHRPKKAEEKFKFIKRNRNLDTVTIEETEEKSVNQFHDYIQLVHSDFQIEKIENETKKLKILESMRNFLLRGCWKMQDVLPYDNDLLKQIIAFYPSTFNY